MRGTHPRHVAREVWIAKEGEGGIDGWSVCDWRVDQPALVGQLDGMVPSSPQVLTPKDAALEVLARHARVLRHALYEYEPSRALAQNQVLCTGTYAKGMRVHVRNAAMQMLSSSNADGMLMDHHCVTLVL